MAKYVLTHRAVEDLSEIWDYTYEVWSEAQADTYYEHLIESFEDISKNPLIGKNYSEIKAEIYGIRMGKHLIF